MHTSAHHQQPLVNGNSSLTAPARGVQYGNLPPSLANVHRAKASSSQPSFFCDDRASRPRRIVFATMSPFLLGLRSRCHEYPGSLSRACPSNLALLFHLMGRQQSLQPILRRQLVQHQPAAWSSSDASSAPACPSSLALVIYPLGQ